MTPRDIILLHLLIFHVFFITQTIFVVLPVFCILSEESWAFCHRQSYCDTVNNE